MSKELFFFLKDKAREAKENLSRVLRSDCRVHEIKKNEIIFFCPEHGKKYRALVSPGLQEGTYSLSCGEAGSDSNGFMQRDVTKEDLLRLLTSPMIWSWTYKSFNHRFSQVLNGIIRLAYEKKEAREVLWPLIEKALDENSR